MAHYGYDLFSDETPEDFVELLLSMSSTNDQRVIEGIPVVIANHLLRNGYHKFEKDTLKLLNQLQYHQESSLLQRTCLLYVITAALLEKELMLKKEANRIRKLIAHSMQYPQGGTELLSNNSIITQDGLMLDPGRLQKTFRLYAMPKKEKESPLERSAIQRQITLEYNLSKLFPLKQKELIKKKISGEQMTKTEREYYSRVIKRKITAIVDPDMKDFLIQSLK